MKNIAKHHLYTVNFLVVIIMFIGCSAHKTVERIETDTTVDLSGRLERHGLSSGIRSDDSRLSKSPVDYESHEAIQGREAHRHCWSGSKHEHGTHRN